MIFLLAMCFRDTPISADLSVGYGAGTLGLPGETGHKNPRGDNVLTNKRIAAVGKCPSGPQPARQNSFGHIWGSRAVGRTHATTRKGLKLR